MLNAHSDTRTKRPRDVDWDGLFSVTLMFLIVGSIITLLVAMCVSVLSDHARLVELRDDIRSVASEVYGATLSEEDALVLIPDTSYRRDSKDVPELGLIVDGEQYTVHYVPSAGGPMLVQPNGQELLRR